MKRLLWLLLFTLPAVAQVTTPGVQYVTVAPSGACVGAPPIRVVTSTGAIYTCANGTWGQQTSGGAPGTVTSVSVTTANGVSGTVATATTTPAISLTLGAITPSSMIASGIADGQAPMTITTGSSATLGGTYSSGYTVNENATAATAVTYTLPTAVAGKQYCIANGNNGSAANTGVLELATSASGQYIVFTDGTLSASGGNVTSGGAAGDKACAVGLDSTHWLLYTQSGTWTKN